MDLRNQISDWSEILNIASKWSFLGPLLESKRYIHFLKSYEWFFHKFSKNRCFLAPRYIQNGPWVIKKLIYISNSSRGPSKQPNETDKKKVSDKVAPFLRSDTCKLDDVSKTRCWEKRVFVKNSLNSAIWPLMSIYQAIHASELIDTDRN